MSIAALDRIENRTFSELSASPQIFCALQKSALVTDFGPALYYIPLPATDYADLIIHKEGI